MNPADKLGGDSEVRLLYASLLALDILVGPSRAEPYVMAGAGITVNMPRGWEMTRWSDWDFKAKADGLILDLWYTPWQVDVPVGTAMQPVYLEHLAEQHAKNPAVLPGIAGEGAKRWLHTRATFDLDGGGRAVAHFAAIPGDGKVLHIGVYGTSSADKRSSAALDAYVAALTMEAPPAPLNAASLEAPDRGFTVTPPQGWRSVLPSERENAEALFGKTGAGKLEACVLLAAPTADGRHASLIAACPQVWQVGFADDASFADDALVLRGLVFGKAVGKIPAAEKVALADRNAMLFRPTINDYQLLFAATSYDKGAISLWAIGPDSDAAGLEAGVKGALSGLVFPGPENGLAQHALGEIVYHELSYNPLVMGVAGLGVFGVLGGFGAMLFRKPTVA
ncbi:MAG: hypothetical protein EXR69_03740 [Myxococcales bacterium]|nr:hypothetical protein [Myxococcales bacterium]